MANKYYGIYQGVVTNNTDTEKRGRIKVKCPEVLGGNTESAWCDPCVNVAYDTGGDFCIPAKEETVWIMFIAGDPNRPVWLGGWWQRSMTPLGENYTKVDQVRIINYADCTITMQDGKININVGDGVCDLKIEHNTVTVEGDLLVNGKVTASEIEVDTENGLGDVNIAGKLKVTGNTTLKATEVTTLKATGKTTLKNTEATEVTVNGVKFSTHTHSGVETGSGNTDVPQ